MKQTNSYNWNNRVIETCHIRKTGGRFMLLKNTADFVNKMLASSRSYVFLKR